MPSLWRARRKPVESYLIQAVLQLVGWLLTCCLTRIDDPVIPAMLFCGL